ncbi:ORF6N domain-containing protein [Peredibacter starrii]|uniref:ORF6N domain-containing protein n=1 Tax=Peredibacter starrii TaxID=28202 RepID=A0AAX4HLR0_9BACT|nr:ORF6N domain-containing protein [Peredibacter starrii]WPU63864.1 ORF6N domain-containing protein [Peredibacter starrii]
MKQIEKFIYTIRGQRVMLDSDLAELYGVTNKRLSEQVRRNLSRFPSDFMFECDLSELDDLRSQFAAANPLSGWNTKRRTMPMLFTESGVAMLSTVLNSERAIQVNISIIRTFIKLRSFLSMESSASNKVDELERKTNKLFKIVFERMDSYEEAVTPKLPPHRKKIGLKRDQ